MIGKKEGMQFDNSKTYSYLNKISLIPILFGIVAVFLVSAFVYQSLRNVSYRDISSSLLKVSTLISQQAENSLSDSISILEYIAHLKEFSTLDHVDKIDRKLNGIPENVDSEKRYLLENVRKNHGFSVVFILLPNGDHYLSHPFSVQKSLRSGYYNLSHRPYFQKSQATKRTVVSDGFRGADNELAVVIDVPILNKDNTIRAHLGGVFHLKKFSQVVTSSLIKDFDIGFIVDSKGHAIAHSDMRLLGDGNRKTFSEHPLIKGHLAQKLDSTVAGSSPSTILQEYSDPVTGIDYLATLSELSPGWTLVLLTDKDKALSANKPYMLKLSLLAGIILIVVSFAGAAVIRKIGVQWAGAEQKIQKHNAFLETVLESLPYPFYVIDAKTYTIVIANSLLGPVEKWQGSTCHKVTHHSDQPCIEDEHKCPLKEVIQTGKPVIIEHIHFDRENNRRYVEVHGYPIFDERGNVVQMIEYSIDITDRKEMEQKLVEASIMDELTGIHNRRGFISLARKQLQVAMRSSQSMFLLFADLDNMKWINDELGHHVGDEALQDTAKLLKHTFRESDIIGRLGGDEFAVLLTNESDESSRELILNRLQKKVEKFNAEHDRKYTLSLSAGLSFFNGEKPRFLEELLSEADRLMYEEKNKKRGITPA